jgi:CopA family copper-resistance protein
MLGRSFHCITFVFSLLFLCSPYLLAQHAQHTMSSSTMTTSQKFESKAPKTKKQVPKKQQLMSKSRTIKQGPERVINLVVGYKMVNYAGKLRRAIAVNDQIPAPTLHFKEGERVTINVYNQLDKGTSIHWHGLLVPWQMDGVENVSQKAIPPGSVFHYRFTLYQEGTYWYHAHADAQEQEGLYGAFLIDPPTPPKYRYTKDYVVVLSDWSNTKADQVYANLKKDGEYFSPRFPLQPSLSKFIHDYRKADASEGKKLIADYKMMEQMRMSIYDISDVAYDAYLLNGQPKSHPWTAPVQVGDVVRLRFIGAGGSTIYRVKIPGKKMTMVHVQGNDVRPYRIEDFSIAPGETYDVLVTIQQKEPYIIYAESIDTLGKAYGALVTESQQAIPYNQVTPFPEPLPVTREMMANMMMTMNHGSMLMNGNSKVMRNQEQSGEMKPGMSKSFHAMNSMNNKSSSSQHNTKVMSTMKNNHSGHSLQPMKSKSGMPMSQDMDRAGMKHDAMGSMAEHRKQKNHSSSSMAMNSESAHSMKSMPGNENQSLNSGHSMTTNKKNMSEGMSMGSSMSMPIEPSIIGDTIVPMDKSTSATTLGTKYQDLTAAVVTNDPNKPVDGVIRMELFGYMDRFIWMINGLPEYKAKPILIEPGKRYRIIFTNNSMMRHPMHIHGHWFILRNGHGSYDPLLHTIEVAPGATAVADFDTDASGQWFFHCHHLFHMMAGMARSFQYETIIEVEKGKAKPETEIVKTPYVNRSIVRVDEVMPIDPYLIKHPGGHQQGFYRASFLDLDADPFHNVQEMTFRGLYGGDYNKLQLFVNDAELNQGSVEYADIDVFYWHLISQFWAIKGGANFFYRPGGPYWQPGLGIEGLMPYYIDMNIRTYYHQGSVKLDAEFTRDTQLTNNVFLRTSFRSILATKTIVKNEIGSGLNQLRYTVRPYYRLMPGFNLFTEFEYNEDYGALKRILSNLGEATTETTVSFGVSVIF